MFKQIAIAAVLSLYGAFGALAATTPLVTTPPAVETPSPVASCPGGNKTWEEGRADFDAMSAGTLVYEGTKEFEDKTIAVVYAIVDNPMEFFVIFFDDKHCYITSQTVDAGTVATELGIIVATE